MIYVWLKTLHVAAVIVWSGGIIGTTMVVASQSGPRSQSNKQYSILSDLHRWTECLTSPVTLVVWLSGIALALGAGTFSQRWLIAKMGAVLVLTAIQAVAASDLENLVFGRLPSSRVKHRALALWAVLLLGLTVCLTVFNALLS